MSASQPTSNPTTGTVPTPTRPRTQAGGQAAPTAVVGAAVPVSQVVDQVKSTEGGLPRVEGLAESQKILVNTPSQGSPNRAMDLFIGFLGSLVCTVVVVLVTKAWRKYRLRALRELVYASIADDISGLLQMLAPAPFVSAKAVTLLYRNTASVSFVPAKDFVGIRRLLLLRTADGRKSRPPADRPLSELIGGCAELRRKLGRIISENIALLDHALLEDLMRLQVALDLLEEGPLGSKFAGVFPNRDDRDVRFLAQVFALAGMVWHRVAKEAGHRDAVENQCDTITLEVEKWQIKAAQLEEEEEENELRVGLPDKPTLDVAVPAERPAASVVPTPPTTPELPVIKDWEDLCAEGAETPAVHNTVPADRPAAPVIPTPPATPDPLVRKEGKDA